MNILKGNTPQNIRFGEKKSKYYFHIRAFFALLGALLVFGVYINWQTLLEKWMTNPWGHLRLWGRKHLRQMQI